MQNSKNISQFGEWHSAECHYANCNSSERRFVKCRSTECHGAEEIGVY
jgi:hypothetical protein